MPDVERPEVALLRKTKVQAEPTARFDQWWFLFLAVVIAVALLVFVKPNPFQRIVLFLRDGIWVTVRIRSSRSCSS